MPAVVDFLRHRASLSLPQLHRFVRCRPSILTVDVPSNLLLKLTFFHSILSVVGASPDVPPPKELAALVSACAPAFGYSAAARLAPALDFLYSLFAGDNRKVASTLRRCPRLLTNDPKKVLARNLAVLRCHGLDATALVEKAPIVLILSPEWLDTAFRTVEEELNIVNASVDGYFDAVYLAASMSENAFKNKMGMLRSYGFSNAELLTLIRRASLFFRLTDEHMEKSWSSTFTLSATLRTHCCGTPGCCSSAWRLSFCQDMSCCGASNQARQRGERRWEEAAVEGISGRGRAPESPRQSEAAGKSFGRQQAIETAIVGEGQEEKAAAIEETENPTSHIFFKILLIF